MARGIAVFDSGVGGLTVLAAIRRRLPATSTFYLGDTARVPYGNKSAETVIRYARACAKLLLQHDPALLVVACNTATAHALPTLQAELPIPVIGVVEPGAALAAALAPDGRIGVAGTAGTIASGAYQRAIAALAPGAIVQLRSCPLFVPLAEEGWLEGEVPRLVAERYLGELRGQLDVLVLGCTHYPLLAPVIAGVLGPTTRLVDSAEATAAAVAARLGGGPALEPVRHRLFVTDAPARFPALAARFIGPTPESIEQVDL